AGELAFDITHRFESGVQVRASLARRIAPGSILVLFGPSGAGKTTILRVIAGLLRPDSGGVSFDGHHWFDAAADRFVPPQVRRVRRDTGTSAILVTHDRLEAMAMRDDLAVIIEGGLRQVGSVAEVFRRPADPAVARALGVETVVPALVEGASDGLVDLRIG